MSYGIYQIQYLNLMLEEMLPLILQIVICGTIWCQLVALNGIRMLYREIRRREGTPAARAWICRPDA